MSKELENTSGFYFRDCKKMNFTETIPKELPEQVWRKTEELLAGCGFPVKKNQ